MRLKLNKERSEERGAFNDAQMFVIQLQQENCWMRFKTDEDGRMMCIAWAHEAQQLNALRFKTTRSTRTCGCSFGRASFSNSM